jgi:hypothetical protein
MTQAKGFVVPTGGGKHFASPTPGRSFAVKLLGRETSESIMMFPAAAGGLIEALAERRPADADEPKKLFERHRWEVVGPNPL